MGTMTEGEMDSEREHGEDRSKKRKAGRLGILLAIGLLMVVGGGVGVATWSLEPPEPEPEPDPTFATKVERGAYLFQSSGCEACHGPEGRGGVVNENYLGGTVPALDMVAERMMLFDPEDAEIAVALLEEGRDLTSLTDHPPFRGYRGFLAQYAAIRGVIENGSEAGKLDPAGPTPPLQMPPWRDTLDSDAIDAIVAYLISEFPWDEEEDDEEDLDSYRDLEGVDEEVPL